MNLSTLLIVFALFVASCGGEEPERPSETPAPDEIRFKTIEAPPREDLPDEEITFRTWSFTCEVCGSTMSCREEHPTEETEIELTYESSSASDCAQCSHDWRLGISRSLGPLPDGTLVLVKRGETCGAFVLSYQTTTPEKARYRWWFRTDGGTRLDAGSPAVTSGASECDVESDPGARITFGPFRVDWSGNTQGFGYIYHSKAPGERVTAGTVLICVTDAKVIAGINTADPKWRFKGSPAD